MGSIWRDKDAFLVSRACGGDGSAFDALVTRHRKYIYGLAYRMCGDPEAAEDICVEAFCEAYRGLPRFQPEAKFRTWLHRIAVNVALEHLRQQRAQRRYLPEAQLELAEEVPAGVDTSELAVNRAYAQQVHQAIQALPETQKMAVCLFYLENRSCAEIAQLLRIPRNTVKTRLFYGTRALRDLLTARAVLATPPGGESHADL